MDPNTRRFRTCPTTDSCTEPFEHSGTHHNSAPHTGSVSKLLAKLIHRAHADSVAVPNSEQHTDWAGATIPDADADIRTRRSTGSAYHSDLPRDHDRCRQWSRDARRLNT